MPVSYQQRCMLCATITVVVDSVVGIHNYLVYISARFQLIGAGLLCFNSSQLSMHVRFILKMEASAIQPSPHVKGVIS